MPAKKKPTGHISAPLNPRDNTKTTLPKSLSHNFSGDGEWWGVAEALEISEEEFNALPAKEKRRLDGKLGIYSDRFTKNLVSRGIRIKEGEKFRELVKAHGWWRVLNAAHFLQKHGDLTMRMPVNFIFSYLEKVWPDCWMATEAMIASRELARLRKQKAEIEDAIAQEGEKRLLRAVEEFEALPNASKIEILTAVDNLYSANPSNLIPLGIWPNNYKLAREKSGDGFTRILIRAWMAGAVPGNRPSFLLDEQKPPALEKSEDA